MILEWLERQEIRHKRKHCPHSNLRPIHGDEINSCGGWRLHCRQCNRYVDGPVYLAESRQRTEL